MHRRVTWQGQGPSIGGAMESYSNRKVSLDPLLHSFIHLLPYSSNMGPARHRSKTSRVPQATVGQSCMQFCLTAKILKPGFQKKSHKSLA